MTFKEISKKLEIEEIKELGKLSAATKALKEARDRELEAIIKGEDDRILLVLVHLIMKKRRLNMPVV